MKSNKTPRVEHYTNNQVREIASSVFKACIDNCGCSASIATDIIKDVLDRMGIQVGSVTMTTTIDIDFHD